MAEDFAAMEFYPLRDGTLNRTGLWNDVAAFDMTTPGNMFNSRFYIVEYSPIPEPSSAGDFSRLHCRRAAVAKIGVSTPCC